MSSTFTAIDLSQLPPPDVIEPLSFETILAAMLTDLQARDATFSALVESDPAYKILEVAAYRELLLRQRVNDAARAVMLAYATGADLDQIGALFGVVRLTNIIYHDKLVISGVLNPNVAGKLMRTSDEWGLAAFSTDGKRLPFSQTGMTPGLWVYVSYNGAMWFMNVFQDGTDTEKLWGSNLVTAEEAPSPADADWSGTSGIGGPYGGATGVPSFAVDPGEAEVYVESDKDFRRRIQLALEGFSTAGPEGAYVFWALSAHVAVLDVSATSPGPGEVLITVLSRVGSGVPDTQILTDVYNALNDESIRPLTDNVSVQPATIVEFSVQADVYTYNGPDAAIVLSKAKAALNEYLAGIHRLGFDVSISGIYAALHQAGVQRVNLISPESDIAITPEQAPWCTSILINHVGTDE